MQKPSEEARYLASWLKLHDSTWLKYEDGCNDQKQIDITALTKEIDEYFNSRC